MTLLLIERKMLDFLAGLLEPSVSASPPLEEPTRRQLICKSIPQILKTATSALQLLRHNAAPFTFHVIPDSVAPLRTTGSDGVHHFQRSNAGKAHMTELPDGCGTLVCLNSQEPTDRAMVMLVRPPWLIGAREMRNFAKGVVSGQ